MGELAMFDTIQKAAHYNQHPSGVEAIEISRHLPGNLAQAFQYVFRAPYKGDQIRDLRKATYFLRDQAKHLGPAGDTVPDRVLALGLQVMDHERDHRLREAMSAILVCTTVSGLEKAAQLIDAVADELERRT